MSTPMPRMAVTIVSLLAASVVLQLLILLRLVYAPTPVAIVDVQTMKSVPVSINAIEILKYRFDSERYRKTLPVVVEHE
jgi:hypothetical protein